MARQVAAHYLHPPDPQALSSLRARLLPRVRLTTGSGPVPADTEVLIAGRPKREQFEACKNLRALIVPWSGIPNETRVLLKSYPAITLHNLHHNAAPVAELALTLLLATAKQILPLDRSLRENDWTPRYLPSRAILLEGKTALVLGYGAIGQRVASLCHHLGMDVLVIRRRPGSNQGPEAMAIHPPEMFHTLLPRCNALIICLPHTQETDGLVGQAELDLLPNEAVLVNVGRGTIVDEGALYSALSDGRLQGAGLDVWYNYPVDEASRSNTPPANYPFHELENVVLSPHRAGDSTDTERLRMHHLASLLNAIAEGKVMPNQVDLTAGY